MSEEEYEIDSQGQFIRDARGNKIRYQGPPSDADTDEYDVASEREREQANLQRYGRIWTRTYLYLWGPNLEPDNLGTCRLLGPGLWCCSS